MQKDVRKGCRSRWGGGGRSVEVSKGYSQVGVKPEDKGGCWGDEFSMQGCMYSMVLHRNAPSV
jgi:hypothetical protein